MPRINALTNRFYIMASLLVLLVSVGIYKLVYDPPKIVNIFTPAKEGVVAIKIPEKIQVNDPFVVRIEVDTKKQNTNAAGIYIKFDPNKLTLIDMDTSQSFCQFYPEKKFDQLSGTITLACGAPHPGVSGVNNLMNLKFLPTNIGSAELFILPHSKLLLSDGKGTNILTDYAKVRIDILNHI